MSRQGPQRVALVGTPRHADEAGDPSLAAADPGVDDVGPAPLRERKAVEQRPASRPSGPRSRSRPGTGASGGRDRRARRGRMRTLFERPRSPPNLPQDLGARRPRSRLPVRVVADQQPVAARILAEALDDQSVVCPHREEAA